MAKCKYKIGTEQVPFKRVENAINAVANAAVLEDGLEAGYAFMPKTKVSPQQWVAFFHQYVAEQRAIRGKKVTPKDVVDTGTVTRNVKKLVDYFNLDKYTYKVAGKSYYSLSNDTIDYIRAKKKQILEDGTISAEEVDTILDNIENVVNKDEAAKNLKDERKSILSAIENKLGDRVQLKQILKAIFKPDPYLAKEAGRLGELQLIYEMLTQRSIVLELGDIDLLSDLAMEINEGINDNFDNKVESKVLKEDDLVEKQLRVEGLLATSINLDNLSEISAGYITTALPFFTEEYLSKLSNKDLRILQLAVNNIERGVLPHTAYNALLRLYNQSQGGILINKIATLNPSKLWRSGKGWNVLVGKLRDTNTLTEHARNLDTARIDSRLGNYTDMTFLKILFNPLAQAVSAKDNFRQTIFDEGVLLRSKLEKALLKKHTFGTFRAKVVEEMLKAKLYQLAIEHESNPNERTPKQFIDIVFKKGLAKGAYTSGQLDLISNVWDSISDSDGNVDPASIFESLTPQGKDIVKFNIDKVNSNTDAIGFLAGSVRNQPTKIVLNQTHHNYVSDDPKDSGIDIVERAFNESLANTSAKTNIINIRKEVGGSEPLIRLLDPIGDTIKASNAIQVDLQLTPEIQKIHGILKILEAETYADKKTFDAIQKEIAEALKNLVSGSIALVLDRSVPKEQHWFEKLGDHVSSLIYRLKLATIERVAAEWASNPMYVFAADSRSAIKGAEVLTRNDKGTLLAFAVKNKSWHLQRLFSKNGYSKEMRSSLLSDKPFKSTELITNPFQRGVQFTADLISKNPVVDGASGFLDDVDDFTMAGADVLAGWTAYFGRYARRFKEETGEDLDFLKYVNDSEYAAKWKATVDGLQIEVDEFTTSVGTAQNPALSAQSIQHNSNDPGYINAYRAYNGFFSTYNLSETSTGISAYQQAVNDGYMSKREAGGRIVGILMRQVMYQVTKILGADFLVSLFRSEEDEEEDGWLSIDNVAFEFLVAILNIFYSRDQGNASKIFSGNLLEEFNEWLHLKMGVEYTKDDELTYRKFKAEDLDNPKNSVFKFFPIANEMMYEAQKLYKDVDIIEALILYGVTKKKVPFGGNIVKWYRGFYDEGVKKFDTQDKIKAVGIDSVKTKPLKGISKKELLKLKRKK